MGGGELERRPASNRPLSDRISVSSSWLSGWNYVLEAPVERKKTLNSQEHPKNHGVEDSATATQVYLPGERWSQELES